MARVVVDAMGGDHAPAAIVQGSAASMAAVADLEVVLVGDEERIRAVLPEGIDLDRVTVVHAADVIEMHESPVQALRTKADTSIARCVALLANGEADALVSAGNTGGVVAAATFGLKRLPSARRAGIAVAMPSKNGPCVLMDVGANVQCKPLHLVQYAVMATEYARHALGIEDPRVALLSVGGEETKGNPLVKKVGAVLRAYDQVHFIGNVEGQEIFSGEVDVVVCDGFVGNVILKAAEGLSEVFYRYMQAELRAHMGESDERVDEVLADFRQDTDYEKYGGAPLIGHVGSVFICHGRSSATALENAVTGAAEYVHHHVQDGIASALDRLASSTAVSALVNG